METIRFDELELNPKILRGIKDMGFEEATPIQAQGIPAVLSGRDVIGQAQTGTGKRPPEHGAGRQDRKASGCRAY